MTPTSDGLHPFVVLDALVDGERVDVAALKDALSTDEGRQYFVDLVALREIALDAAVALAPATTSPRPVWRRWVSVAAAIALSVGIGYAAGHRGPSREQTRPPAAPGGQFISAPAPTLVIKLQPGIDWTDLHGGQ